MKNTRCWWIAAIAVLLSVHAVHGVNPRARSADGWSVLIEAAHDGDATKVAALLAAGASVNDTRAPYRWTALMMAASRGHVEVTKQLLDADADMLLEDSFGRNAWDLTKLRGQEETAALLEEAGFLEMDGRVLNAAVIAGDIKEVQRLLDEGADFRRLDGDHRSALTCVLTKPKFGEINVEMLRLLLKAGADPNQRLGRRGSTPTFRYFTSRYQSEEATQMLLEAGADVTVRLPHENRTILHESGFPDNPVLINILIREGLSVDDVDERGNTPLHRAVSSRKPNNVRHLLELGADPHARNARGETPVDILTNYASYNPEATKAIRAVLIERGLLGAAHNP